MRGLLYCCTLMLFAPCALQAQDVLLREQNLVYEGAFRVPSGVAAFGYSGYATSYNPVNNSLFMASIYRETVAEVSIPALVKSSSASSLNVATVLRSWIDPTDGNRRNIGVDGATINEGGVFIGGMLVYNNRLIGSTYLPYDAGGNGWLSHWDRSLDLSASGTFRGNFRMGADVYHPNHKNGHMTHIPSAYQEALGGDILTGNNGMSIVTTTSFGPSVWSFYGSDLGKQNPIPNNYLLGYPPGGGRWTLGAYADQGDLPPNPYWSPASNTRGVVFPENSKTILFFGRHGNGPWCYKTSCTGELYPETSIPGNDARPYTYRVWAYNVDDLIAVKNGHTVTQEDYNSNRFWTGQYPNNTTLAVGQVVQPWNVVPYDKWDLNLPIPSINPLSIGDLEGAGYDPVTQRIYLAQFRASGDEPVIHVYSLELDPGTPVKGAPIILKIN